MALSAAAQTEAPQVPKALAALSALEHLPKKGESGPYVWSTGQYGYDGAGNITAIGSQTSGYDALSRLTQSVTVTAAGPNAESYTYDPYGNQTARTTVGLSGHGLMAFTDGAIPDIPFCHGCDEYTDPFAAHGAYDVKESGMRAAQIAGVPTGEVGMAVIGGQLIKFGELGKSSRLFNKASGLLNKNDYLRIGWSWRGSRVAGEPVFRVVVGGRNVLRGVPAVLRHIDFW